MDSNQHLNLAQSRNVESKVGSLLQPSGAVTLTDCERTLSTQNIISPKNAKQLSRNVVNSSLSKDARQQSSEIRIRNLSKNSRNLDARGAITIQTCNQTPIKTFLSNEQRSVSELAMARYVPATYDAQSLGGGGRTPSRNRTSQAMALAQQVYITQHNFKSKTLTNNQVQVAQ